MYVGKHFGYRNPSAYPLEKVGSDWVVHETGLPATPVTWEEIMKEQDHLLEDLNAIKINEEAKRHEQREDSNKGSMHHFEEGATFGFKIGRAQGIKEALNFLRSERMSLSQVFVDTIEKHLTSKPRT